MSDEDRLMNETDITAIAAAAAASTKRSTRQQEETDQQNQSINRKWVKQMKKRIRDLVSNTNSGGAVQAGGELNSFGELSLVDSFMTAQLSANEIVDDFTRANRNFGVRLDKCEPSSISPVRSHSLNS